MVYLKLYMVSLTPCIILPLLHPWFKDTQLLFPFSWHIYIVTFFLKCTYLLFCNSRHLADMWAMHVILEWTHNLYLFILETLVCLPELSYLLFYTLDLKKWLERRMDSVGLPTQHCNSLAGSSPSFVKAKNFICIVLCLIGSLVMWALSIEVFLSVPCVNSPFLSFWPFSVWIG